MIPHRQHRRPLVRRVTGDRMERPENSSAHDAGARRLLAANAGDTRRLELLVADLHQLRDDADRRAVDDPSLTALREYRRAVRALAEAQRAVVLAGGRRRPTTSAAPD